MNEYLKESVIPKRVEALQEKERVVENDFLCKKEGRQISAEDIFRIVQIASCKGRQKGLLC